MHGCACTLDPGEEILLDLKLRLELVLEIPSGTSLFTSSLTRHHHDLAADSTSVEVDVLRVVLAGCTCARICAI